MSPISLTKYIPKVLASAIFPKTAVILPNCFVPTKNVVLASPIRDVSYKKYIYCVVATVDVGSRNNEPK